MNSGTPPKRRGGAGAPHRSERKIIPALDRPSNGLALPSEVSYPPFDARDARRRKHALEGSYFAPAKSGG